MALTSRTVVSTLTANEALGVLVPVAKYVIATSRSKPRSESSSSPGSLGSSSSSSSPESSS
eukprot:14735975-Heterocapsa_arctica.AAC.1